MKLAMNESTKKVAVAFANNTIDRKAIVYMRENILDAMPIGAPLTCTEIAENVEKLGVASFWGFNTLKVSVGNVAQCMKSLIPFGVVEKRVVKLDTPYSFEVESGYYDSYQHCWVSKKKTITRDTVTKYVRVV